PGRAATPGSGEDTWGSATLTELIAWPDELNVERYRAAESLVDSANTTAFALQPAASGCRPAPRLRPGSDGGVRATSLSTSSPLNFALSNTVVRLTTISPSSLAKALKSFTTAR